MNLVLKDFQEERTAEFVQNLRRASRDVREYDEQWAVSLASPTGSGKTVMSTAAIETLLTGDAEHPPDLDLTVLWITDQPELNEQTRQRMLETSTELGSARLVDIDTDFDQETFDPGTVYFVNTQKLGKKGKVVRHGDDRTFTLWDTVRNTVEARPTSFYVFLDEAHRGMQQSPRARNEANSIVQKFILGSEGEIPPVPLITGISATPARFNALVEGTQRTRRQVVVEPSEVRESGLLKDAIIVFHPTEDQPGDITMLRGAVREWQDYTERWKEYCEAQNEPFVRPLLAIQVQDAKKNSKKVSATNLDRVMEAILSEASDLPDAAFGHALQEKGEIEMYGREVRYIAPSDIQRDENVRVVFFKSALNTGWDCPRAEVMMSFRTAKDETHIAQLIGRMVRTPLARRIDADEHLNTVALFLPHFDGPELDKVIAHLSEPDPDVMPTVEVRKATETLTVERAPGTEAIFEALAKTPSYIIPRTRKVSEIARLMKLARRLSNDALRPDAPDEGRALLLDALRSELEVARKSERFKTFLSEDGKLDVAAVRYEYGQTGATQSETKTFHTAAENVEDLFAAAGRRLGEGLHKTWWKARVAEDNAPTTEAKLELGALLAADPEVLVRLKDRAQEQTDEWLKEYHDTIQSLDEGERKAYNDIRGLATKPEATMLTHPEVLDVKKEAKAWKHHVYADADDSFPAKFNTWETQVLEEEMRRDGFMGWLRNTDRKDWALAIPYRAGSDGWKGQYPDFLIFREGTKGIVVDVLEPHDITRPYSAEKAVGLAEFARDHGHRFGRIQLIILDGDVIKRLDMNERKTREKALDVKTVPQLRQLFG